METRSVVVQKNAAVTSKLTLSQPRLLSSKIGFASGLLPLDYPPIFDMLFGKGCINFWLFIALHVIMGIGLFYYSLTWKMTLLVVASYYFQMFGVTGGYHRYFSHRSFKTGRVFQFVLAWLAQTSIQKGKHIIINNIYSYTATHYNYFSGCTNFTMALHDPDLFLCFLADIYNKIRIIQEE